MTFPYSALLLLSDLRAEYEEAFEANLSGVDIDTQTTTENIIIDVTRMIEGLLDRALIVKAYTHYFDYNDWEYNRSRSKWEARAPQWPVAQVSTSGFTAGASRNSWRDENDLILYTSRFCGAVTYYAGYARSEQTLVGLQAETGLSSLSVLPDTLPSDIRGVAINGVMHALYERRKGPGQRSVTLNPAVQSTLIDEPIRDYLQRIVRERIYHHKKIC